MPTVGDVPRLRVDVLVAGGGGAAVRAAVEAARRGASVRLLCKGRLGQSGLTATATSEILSIGAALAHADPRDTPEVHYRDTLRGGNRFCDSRLVRILAEEAPQRVMDLVALGVPFDREGDRLRQGLSDFATYPRACRVGGRTGVAILEALLAEARRLRIPTHQETMIADLLIDDGRVVGAVALDVRSGELVAYQTGAVVLATGGVGDAFAPTLSDETMTGDGLGLALRAGARLVNMDFHQLIPGIVHPFKLVLSKPFYDLRPRLINSEGEEFLSCYVPHQVSLEDVYRHKVSPYSTSNPSRYLDEAIYKEIRAGRCTAHRAIYYDFTSCTEDDFLNRVPITYALLRDKGVDPTRELVEVGILFQMINGGVLMANTEAMTDVAGLFVAGEAAGGVRGPDRPGGNSLAEGQVFGARAGRFATEWARGHGRGGLREAILKDSLERVTGALKRPGGGSATRVRQALKETMWDCCLVAKNGSGLRCALSRLDELGAELAEAAATEGAGLAAILGLENALVSCRAIVLSALAREETRASHYREDFPEADDRLRKSTVVTAGRDGLQVGFLEYANGR